MAGGQVEDFLQASGWGCVAGLLQLHHLANGRGDGQLSQQEQTGGVRRSVSLTALDDQVEHVPSLLATKAVEVVVVRIEGEAVVMTA